MDTNDELEDDELEEPSVPEPEPEVGEDPNVKTSPPPPQELLLTSKEFTLEGGVWMFQATLLPHEGGHVLMTVCTINNDVPNIDLEPVEALTREALGAQVREAFLKNFDLLMEQLPQRQYAASHGIIIEGATFRVDKSKPVKSLKPIPESNQQFLF